MESLGESATDIENVGGQSPLPTRKEETIGNSIEMAQNPQMNESKIRTITFNEFDNSFNRKRQTVYNNENRPKETSIRKKIIHKFRKFRAWIKQRYHQSFVEVIVTCRKNRHNYYLNITLWNLSPFSHKISIKLIINILEGELN